MALLVNGAGSRRFRGSPAISEINVTPFVDVLLVLLIIFMITAHVMEFGIDVDVPKVSKVRDSAKDLPVVNITKDGSIFLNKDAVNINELPQILHERFSGHQAVYLRADKDTPWGIGAQVMSALGDAKFNVSVVTQPLDETGRR